MEALIVGFILIGILVYNNTIDKTKFLIDNEKYLQIFREEDYTFLIYAKYGEDVDADQLYMKRITYALITFFIMLAFTVAGGDSASVVNSQFFLNFVLSSVIAILIFKVPYMQLKSFYKAHLHEIDIMLPYYLKSLEILIQHYTVPVALGKSIDDAPDIFKPGLRELIDKINSGDSSIDPYMEFANTYPVRDSMRMMRLLYRLGLGRQDRKQEQLLNFSRSISSLQQKARDTKYKERLDKMENKTMSMLISTGLGVMILLVLAVMQMMNG